MTKGESFIPSPFIEGIERGSKHPMLINVGMMISLVDKIQINVEINHEDHYDPPDSNDPNGKFENLQVHLVKNDKAITLTSLFLPSVDFNYPGMYEIRTNIFGSDEHGNIIEDPIDRHISYFYVLMKD